MFAAPNFAPDLYGADAITMIVAVVAALVTTTVRWARSLRPIATRRKIIVDMLNGSVIYPFLVLIYSCFNTSAFTYIQASKLSVALAGGVGIVFVFGELVLSCSQEQTQPRH